MVFARMSHWKFKKGQREDGIKTLDDSVSDSARKTKGYKGSLILSDDNDHDAAVIITLWESEEAREESQKGLFKDAIGEIDRFIEDSPDTKNYKLDEGEFFM